MQRNGMGKTRDLFKRIRDTKGTFHAKMGTIKDRNCMDLTVADFIFLGSKITADGDCSHEIKRPLLLGRKAMSNLDSILKSRDIAFPTKVHLVKAMVFPVVMYGCERWIIKKAEHQRLMLFNCGVGENS